MNLLPDYHELLSCAIFRWLSSLETSRRRFRNVSLIFRDESLRDKSSREEVYFGRIM